MSFVVRARRAIKLALFGEHVPEEIATGTPDPQTEICVWLHGMGPPIDVTLRQSTACSDPFIVCVSFDRGQAPDVGQRERLSLRFCRNDNSKTLLGIIGLRWRETVEVRDAEFMFFRPRSASNFCLKLPALWGQYLLHIYRYWKTTSASSMTMTFLERRAAMVSFIRPHITFLGSMRDELGGSIFPMNIMGPLGQGRFGFALRDDRYPAHLIERSGRLVLSTVPLSQAAVAYGLATNHTKTSIAWKELPFETKVSPVYRIPFPEFAQRIRELEVEKVCRIGSHTFFVARVVHEESFFAQRVLCIVHGYYQKWRHKGNAAALTASLADDSAYKRW
jgi:hypothetical protein